MLGRNGEGSGDAGVESGEFQSVLFGEGEEMGIGGVSGTVAPGREGAGGGEVIR